MHKTNSAIKNHPEMVARQQCPGCKQPKRRLKCDGYCSRRCKSRGVTTGVAIKGI